MMSTSPADIVRRFADRIGEMRQDGETWDRIGEMIQGETGETLSVPVLRATYSRIGGKPTKPVSAQAKRPVVRPVAAGKPAQATSESDPSDALRAALAASETRASRALSERDSASEAASKMEADRNRLVGEIERLRSEIERGKRQAEAGAGGKHDGVIDDLRAELSEARSTISRWEEWSDQQKQNAPRSRPIMAAAAMAAALIVGAVAGGYGSRILADHEPVKVAAVEVKPAPTKTVQPTDSQTVKVPEKALSDRPAGLPPLPPKPIVEGVLTGAKTIKLFE